MRLWKKTLIISIIIILFINVCAPICLADQDPNINKEGSLAGAILYVPFQWLMGIITAVLEIIAETVTDKSPVTPGDIIFNDGVEITSINFFSDATTEPFVKAIRDSVAKWYYGIRTIAIVASLCVLIYISIRMAISSAADEKGQYKTMLKDWLVSFALIFVLHYIMMIVIYGNDIMVEVFKTALTTDVDMATYVQSLHDVRWGLNSDIPVAYKFGANAVSLLLAILTLAFLIMYIKRFIVIAFLIMIAPLITITYSIDKIKDGQSQALNTWGKEFFWTVAIQPFHCVIYLVFVSTSLTLIKNADFASSLMAIVCMGFILQAEGIVKKIFGIQAENIGKVSAMSALVAGGVIGSMGKLKNAPSKAASMAGKKEDKKPRNTTTPRTTPPDPQQTAPTGAPTGPQPNGSGATTQTTQTTAGNPGPQPAGPTSGPAQTQNANAPQEFKTNFMDSPKVQEGIQKFADALRGNTFVKAASTAGRWYAKAALGVVGATTTFAVDPDGLKMAIGAKAGMSLGDYASGKEQQLRENAASLMEKKVEKGRLNNRQADFDKAYEEYKKQTGKSEEEIIERMKHLNDIKLDGKIGSKIQGVERDLAVATQNLYDQLEKMEEKKPMDEVINRVRLKADHE